MSNTYNFRMLLAAAIIVAFFLPWFSEEGSTASALDIVMQKISNESDRTTRMIVQYSFVLIPFFALIVLIRTAGKKPSGFFLRLLPFLVTAILTTLVIIGTLNEGGKEALNSWLQVLSYGFYITAAASLLLIFI